MKNVTLNNFSATVQRLNIILSFLPLGRRGRKTVSHVLLILCLTTWQYYNWVDEDPAVGELYYRLTEVEDDGSKNVLRIIATNSNCYVNNDLIVYPNPTVNSLNIVYASDAAGTATIEILDELGRVVLTTEKPLIIGDNNHIIAVGTLPNAMYMVRLIENNERLIGYEKFVKVEN